MRYINNRIFEELNSDNKFDGSIVYLDKEASNVSTSLIMIQVIDQIGGMKYLLSLGIRNCLSVDNFEKPLDPLLSIFEYMHV